LIERFEMNPIKIDGKALADQKAQQLKQKIDELAARGERPPKLVSFVDRKHDKSLEYTEMKQRRAKAVGIDFQIELISPSTKSETIEKLIREYNNDPTVDGIMVQLPLPEKLKSWKNYLVNLIDPRKDVDGLTTKGRQYYMPATVKGVISILTDGVKIDFQNTVFGVVGSSGEIGKPLVNVLKEKNAQEIVEIDIKSKSSRIGNLKKCDVVISATGFKGAVLKDFVKEGVVAIDVGLGPDFDSEVYEIASFYTPPTGGTGPMTIISLMDNVIQSFKGGEA
jgi:methylenetetrahydrofolate dehydrogenase (NADP+) / methenyltetrahydrofolate cyclohydrolase